MLYDNNTIILKNGLACTLRSPCGKDASAILKHLRLTSGQTDYMMRYPDEIKMTEENEAAYLENIANSDDSIMICAEIDGEIVANAGFNPIARLDKCRHRAEFGISIQKDFWGIGIGSWILSAIISLAGSAGYKQLELDVVSSNIRGISLYEKYGFKNFGKNEKAFRLRDGSYQTTIMMSLEL